MLANDVHITNELKINPIYCENNINMANNAKKSAVDKKNNAITTDKTSLERSDKFSTSNSLTSSLFRLRYFFTLSVNLSKFSPIPINIHY